MGPGENSTRTGEERKRGPAVRANRRRRARRCLLKGCERRFHPQGSAQRYCSEECRQAARRWSRWKAQQSYRATAEGKRRRNRQSQRYRKRVKERQETAGEAAGKSARVISPRFFRLQL